MIIDKRVVAWCHRADVVVVGEGEGVGGGLVVGEGGPVRQCGIKHVMAPHPTPSFPPQLKTLELLTKQTRKMGRV